MERCRERLSRERERMFMGTSAGPGLPSQVDGVPVKPDTNFPFLCLPALFCMCVSFTHTLAHIYNCTSKLNMLTDAYTHIHAYTHTCTQTSYPHTGDSHACIHTNICTHICSHIYTLARTHIYSHTCTLTCAHTQADSSQVNRPFAVAILCPLVDKPP